jgi:AcrR family transcriptional regulator
MDRLSARLGRVTAARTRRERLRDEAQAEIGALGMAQVARGGRDALSLSAIARQMGMSGPAIYRYVPSREALLARLVADVFTSLADEIALALSRVAPGDPDRRFRTIGRTYRAWALTHSREYVLVTTKVTSSEGRGEMLAATERTLGLAVSALHDLDPAGSPDRMRSLAIVAWQRMHGHLTLELEGLHEAMGVDPAILYEDELDAIVGHVRARFQPSPAALTAA